MKRAISPKEETIAYRAWFYCEPLGWNVSAVEAAKALDVPFEKFRSVIAARGWSDWFRGTKRIADMEFTWMGGNPDDGDLPNVRGVGYDD